MLLGKVVGEVADDVGRDGGEGGRDDKTLNLPLKHYLPVDKVVFVSLKSDAGYKNVYIIFS